jgi:hypothetical protein
MRIGGYNVVVLEVTEVPTVLARGPTTKASEEDENNQNQAKRYSIS